MRRLRSMMTVSLLILMSICGCNRSGSSETITNRNIPLEDVTEFCYTYENINYGAFYQRYRFCAENERYTFSHETRERPNDYGPTTKQDITEEGSFELTFEEWLEAMRLLKKGKVSPRAASSESGSSGPWTYIYWKNDKSRYQNFEFSCYEEMKAFEGYCSDLARRER